MDWVALAGYVIIAIGKTDNTNETTTNENKNTLFMVIGPHRRIGFGYTKRGSISGCCPSVGCDQPLVVGHLIGYRRTGWVLPPGGVDGLELQMNAAISVTSASSRLRAFAIACGVG